MFLDLKQNKSGWLAGFSPAALHACAALLLAAAVLLSLACEASEQSAGFAKGVKRTL